MSRFRGQSPSHSASRPQASCLRRGCRRKRSAPFRGKATTGLAIGGTEHHSGEVVQKSVFARFLASSDFRLLQQNLSETDFASTKQRRTRDGLAVARLTPTQATDPHAGRAHPLRYLRRARCEPLLWHVSVARPRHFRGALAMGPPA